MKKKVIYAVKKGHNTGIFTTWDECKEQVIGFKGAEYKGFINISEAKNYLNQEVKQNIVKSEEKPFKVPNGAAEIFVDGSFNPVRNIASYGLVIVKDNKAVLKDFSAYPYSDVTCSYNVGAELIGARRAVELSLANGYKKLVIYYDYLGIEKFAKEEWKPKTPQTIEYQQFMTKYMKLMEIHFVKIKSHSGNKFNDMADKLAKYATNM